MSYHTPLEALEKNIRGGIEKTNLSVMKMMLLGLLAGAFITFGGAASNTVAHAITNVGLSKMIAGAIFPVGLIMILLIGGELFTGNILIAMAVYDGHVTWKRCIRNLAIVYFANMIGAMVVAAMVFLSGNMDISDGAVGAYTIKVAMSKTNLSVIHCIVSGTLCNILVCVAILMGTTSHDIIGKCAATFFPIWAFVICGFEHCVADMYFIPAGLIASTNADYVNKAQELYGISSQAIDASLSISSYFKAIIPITIGNILGGMILGVLCFYNIHKKDINVNKKAQEIVPED